jgi:hypothetical protein
MMNINIFDTDMFPYLEGEALKGSTLTLTIRDIKSEEMASHGGKKEWKYVLYFQENHKGFVLNKTNAKRIAQMYGPTTGDWEGKPIVLYTEEVQAFGETHNALRVAMSAPGNGNGEMTLAKLLTNLNKVERIDGFYSKPEEIMACRSKGAEPPPSDDIEGWRQLFVDARNHAFEQIERAVEDGKIPPAGFADETGSAMDDIEAEDADMMVDSGQVDAHGSDMHSDETQF